MDETAKAPAVPRPGVFVSYPRGDSTFAERLVRILYDRGFDAVIDLQEIDAGEIWKARVRQLILSSDTVVVILTANSAASSVCRWETDVAASCGKRMLVVVPAPLDGVVTPHRLANVPWFHFYNHPTRSDSGIFAGPALEHALKADLEWYRPYTSLFLQAEKWQEHRSDDLLLRGASLKAALTWRSSVPRGETVVAIVSELLDASELAEAHGVKRAGSFEQRLVQLEERRIAADEARKAAEEARRTTEVSVQTRREGKKEENPPPAPAVSEAGSASKDSIPAPTQQTGRQESASPSQRSGKDDRLPVETELASPEDTPARRKKIAAPAMIVLVLFAGAAIVIWRLAPQYLPSPAVVVEGDRQTPAALSSPEPAVAEPETVAPEENDNPVPSPPSPSTAPPKPELEAKPASGEGESSDDADWRAARQTGTLRAFRTYVVKWPQGQHHDQALAAARRRIATLSVEPDSTLVLLTGPVVFRDLPTFGDKGKAAGAAGETVTIIDQIASPKEGEWLVLERDGPWPFQFVSASEIKPAPQ